MRDPAFSIIAREFRALNKAIDDTNRRLANMIMPGRVAEIEGTRVRLELGPPDPKTGKKFLSPWVLLQDAAGATGSHFPVAVGDPMRLVSPHGELGPQSIAMRDSHTQDKPNPAGDPEELVLTHAGCELRMSEAGLTLKKGDTTIVLSADGIFETAQSRNTDGSGLTHNGTDIGDTHKHSGVVPGGALTQPPV